MNAPHANQATQESLTMSTWTIVFVVRAIRGRRLTPSSFAHLDFLDAVVVDVRDGRSTRVTLTVRAATAKSAIEYARGRLLQESKGAGTVCDVEVEVLTHAVAQQPEVVRSIRSAPGAGAVAPSVTQARRSCRSIGCRDAGIAYRPDAAVRFATR
jgi:hypothetical protein